MALAFAVTYIIDPYRIFLTPEISGLNEKKSRAQGEIFFNRMVGIKTVQPTTILLGNSRVQWGMSARSQLWPQALRPVYNAAIPGSNNQTAFAYLQYAIRTGNIKVAVLGLDYLSSLIKINAAADKPVILGNYGPLLSTENSMAQTVKNYFLRIASIDGLIDSFLTIFEQKNPYAPDILPNGDNPLNEYKGYATEKGYHRLFKNYLSGIKKRLGRKDRIFIQETDSSPEFEALKRLIDLAKNNNVKLYMFFHPYHSTLQDLITSVGRREEFDNWKRRILHIVQKRDNVELWDFSTRSELTSEAVPEAGDMTTRMNWYWEPGHYKNGLGEKIISNVFQNNLPYPDRPFGNKLYPK